LEYEYATFVL